MFANYKVGILKEFEVFRPYFGILLRLPSSQALLVFRRMFCFRFRGEPSDSQSQFLVEVLMHAAVPSAQQDPSAEHARMLRLLAGGHKQSLHAS